MPLKFDLLTVKVWSIIFLSLVYASTGAGVMFCFMAAGLSLIYIKKRRRRTGKRKREVDEDAVTGDSKSKK
jgi:hypothetical protein